MQPRRGRLLTRHITRSSSRWRTFPDRKLVCKVVQPCICHGDQNSLIIPPLDDMMVGVLSAEFASQRLHFACCALVPSQLVFTISF